MSNICIRKVELEGIHKRYDLNMEFNDSLNVLHGQNGTGKSTLIHILANAANCDFIRFAFLEFTRIKITYSNSSFITLYQEYSEGDKQIKIESNSGAQLIFKQRDAFEATAFINDEKQFRDFEPKLFLKIKDFVETNKLKTIETSYFPAFRTMLEAWSTQYETSERRPAHRTVTIQKATLFSRNLFGQFLPTINFPSPIDIERSLRSEIMDAQIRIGRYESSVFSDSFVKVFSALLGDSKSTLDTDTLLTEISELTDSSSNSKFGDFEENSNTYRELQSLLKASSKTREIASSATGALTVYRDALKQRQHFQMTTFKEIDKYFNVVNSFLDKKELAYQLLDKEKRSRGPRIGLKFPDNTWSSIKVMSSGERQLLTMLYAVNKMSGNSAVLIDEPELSLHIDWQEDLLGKMMEQLGNRQIIVCTHSPSIAEDFEDYMKEVIPIFKDSKKTITISDDLDCEEDYI